MEWRQWTRLLACAISRLRIEIVNKTNSGRFLFWKFIWIKNSLRVCWILRLMIRCDWTYSDIEFECVSEMSDYTGTVRRLHCRDSTHNNSADDEHIYSTISDLNVPSAHQPQHQHYRRQMKTQFDIEDQTKQCATKQNISSSWQEYWRWCDHFICLFFCASFVSLFLIEFILFASVFGFVFNPMWCTFHNRFWLCSL